MRLCDRASVLPLAMLQQKLIGASHMRTLTGERARPGMSYHRELN